MNTYDLQVHTDASPCARATPADVVRGALDADLDGIAVTNHDTLEGYDAVRTAAPPELDVIPGVEVTTTQGHLLALDVDEVPPRDDPVSVIEHVHDQGGVAVLSHPFDAFRQTYDADLDRIAAAVDAVEGINSRCVLPRFNRRARRFAERNGLPWTGGSDAHFRIEVGRAYTVSDGNVLSAIRDGDVSVEGRGGYLTGHVATKLHQFETRIR